MTVSSASTVTSASDTSAAVGSIVDVPLLAAAGDRSSADRAELTAVDGQRLARVHQAPPMLIRRLVRQLRDLPDPPPHDERLTAIRQAAELFANGTVDGETPQEYLRRHALATGLPAAVGSRAAAEIAQFGQELADTVAAEAADRVVDAGHVRVLRVPRGQVLAVLAPSNHPLPHTAWLHALGHGLRVAVRPGGHDPFTPARLARALRIAGGGRLPALLLPTPPAAAPVLVEAGDLALVYGGTDTVAHYRGRAGTAVRGPGRTKVLVSDPLDDGVVGYLAEAVAGDGGVRCTNVSAVFTTGDADALAAALAERLARLEPRRPLDPGATLPVRPLEAARMLAEQVTRLAAGADDHTSRRYPDGIVADLGDGSAALRPTVLAVPDPTHPAVGVELPYPFVTVARWRPADGLRPLRDSLVLVIIDSQDKLAAAALAEPSIRRVVRGPTLPWWSRPGLPHDGSLADFLLEEKALVGPTGGTP